VAGVAVTDAFITTALRTPSPRQGQAEHRRGSGR
jgi:hypothetical protein